MQAVLGFGEGSLLARELVHRLKLCTDVEVDYAWRLDAGAFVIWMQLPPGGKPERAEAALWTQLDRLGDRGPDPAHLERAKSQMEVALIREIATCGGRAHAVGSGEVLLGSLDRVAGMLDRIHCGDARSARDVASHVFRREAVCSVVAVP